MSSKVIANCTRHIEALDAKIMDKRLAKGIVMSRLSPRETWSSKVHNGTLHLQIKKLQSEIDELQDSKTVLVEQLKKEEETKKNFDSFLRPIVEAGFLVFDNGKFAYTAQQLRVLKGLNDLSYGCHWVKPSIFEKAEVFLASKGFSLDSGDLPGDSSLLSEIYQKHISNTYTCLRYCFRNKSGNFTFK
jgi:hypothetical protein